MVGHVYASDDAVLDESRSNLRLDSLRERLSSNDGFYAPVFDLPRAPINVIRLKILGTTTKMNNKQLFILGGAAVALYIVMENKRNATEKESDEFAKGYAAGWLTPGPVTIIAFGAAAHQFL